MHLPPPSGVLAADNDQDDSSFQQILNFNCFTTEIIIHNLYKHITTVKNVPPACTKSNGLYMTGQIMSS
jgi:hypothetical protein